MCQDHRSPRRRWPCSNCGAEGGQAPLQTRDGSCGAALRPYFASTVSTRWELQQGLWQCLVDVIGRKSADKHSDGSGSKSPRSRSDRASPKVKGGEASRASTPASEAPGKPLQHLPPPQPESSEKLRGDEGVRTEHVVMTPTQLQELLESRLQACVAAKVLTSVKGVVMTITVGLTEQVNALVAAHTTSDRKVDHLAGT